MLACFLWNSSVEKPSFSRAFVMLEMLPFRTDMNLVVLLCTLSLFSNKIFDGEDPTGRN